MSITRNTEPVFQVTKYFKTTFLLLRIDWTYLLPWFKHRIGMLLWSDSKRMWRYSMIHGILCTSAGCGLFCSWVMVNSRLKHLLGGIVCLLQVNQREFIMKIFNFFNSSSLITKDFFPKQLGINWNYKYWNYSSPSYPFESFLETKALLYSLSKFRIIFACKKLSFMQNKWFYFSWMIMHPLTFLLVFHHVVCLTWWLSLHLPMQEREKRGVLKSGLNISNGYEVFSAVISFWPKTIFL